jgi:hypothetical protein
MITASDLAAAGFVIVNDGVFLLAADASVQLWPIGNHFYEMRITVGDSTVGDGNSVVTVVVPKIAIKVTRESTPLAADR